MTKLLCLRHPACVLLQGECVLAVSSWPNRCQPRLLISFLFYAQDKQWSIIIGHFDIFLIGESHHREARYPIRVNFFFLIFSWVGQGIDHIFQIN